MKQIKILIRYLKHFFLAIHTGGHGVHSPGVYNFTVSVLLEKKPFYVFNKIEQLRSDLRNNKSLLVINDFGTGVNRHETVSRILKKSVSTRAEGEVLYRMVNYLKPQTVLELGTSLGVTTSYLAASDSSMRCITMEGAEDIARVARDNFTALGLQNVEVITGNIDVTLPEVLQQVELLDMVYIDANHSLTAVMHYFEMCLQKSDTHTVLVIDDIYWSKGMETAWTKIKEHPMVTTTIDIFHFGIVFLNKDFGKNHFKMRL